MSRASRGSGPLVAVVGRPNVGKSTLVNRLGAKRVSIVSPQQGVTRDVLERTVTWRGRAFRVLDTGGLPDGDRAVDDLVAEAGKQALAAARRADLVAFVIDNETGPMPGDFDLAEKLKRSGKPVILIANKVDEASGELSASQAWSLGLGEPLCVSALHGRGSGDLLDRIVDLLPEAPALAQEESGAEASISIVGRPNVGKSSLFNRLVGEERAIVHSEPGTTRDWVDTVAELAGKTYRFVDTAGLRRYAKTSGLQTFGAARTRDAIERSELALLVLDASQGATAQDQRIAQAVADAGVGAMVVANKWDLVEGKEGADAVRDSISDRLRFISYAPVVQTSAKTGRGVQSIAGYIEKVIAARRKTVSTSHLNTVIHEAQDRNPAPRRRGAAARVLYATQTGTGPPTFTLFATGTLPAEWLRFIEHRLREEFGFPGNPLKLTVRRRTRRS